jgi:hypothetical protein
VNARDPVLACLLATLAWGSAAAAQPAEPAEVAQPAQAATPGMPATAGDTIPPASTPAPAIGPVAPRISAGDRLRVRAPTAAIQDVRGRADGMPGDSLRIRFDGNRLATLPAASLTRVELADGRLPRHRGVVRSGASGASLGLLLGVGVAALLWDEGGDTGGERWAEALRTTAGVVATGAAAGAAWGLVAPGTRWLRLEGDAIPAALGISSPPPPARPAPGDSVVVTTGAGTGASPLRHYGGRLLHVADGSLEVVGGDGAVSRVPLAEVRSVRVHRGQRDRRSAMADGASGGSTVGGLLGLATGLTAYFVARSSDHPHPWKPALVTYVGTGVLGAAMGAGGGARYPGDLWERVSIEDR